MNPNKYFLVYLEGDNSDTHSVFHSTLVIADSEASAKKKFCSRTEYSREDFDNECISIMEINPII